MNRLNKNEHKFKFVCCYFTYKYEQPLEITFATFIDSCGVHMKPKKVTNVISGALK